MNSYICINGKKTELTSKQVQELGFSNIEPVAFGSFSFSEVVNIVRLRKAHEYFKIGDIIKFEEYKLEIIGFNHDKDISGKRDSTITVMAKTLLPARRMHNGACGRGWVDSDLRKWLDKEYFHELPEELKSVICTVEKKSESGSGELFGSQDKLFAPSACEMFGADGFHWDGVQYELFRDTSRRLKLDKDRNVCRYWTRSWAPASSEGNSVYALVVGKDGYVRYDYTNDMNIYVPLCFCIA